MEKSSTSVNDLGDRHLLLIFKYLNLCDRLNLQFVNKRWQNLCSSLWKDYHAFDVCDDELGFGSISEDEINFSICTQVFKSSFRYLTKVNLSWTRGPRHLDLVDLNQCCCLQKLQKPKKTLNNLKETLFECENIEELALCRCVIEVDEQDLKQIFRKNRYLRTLVLAKYDFSGKSLMLLPFQSLESITFEECTFDAKYLNVVLYKAPKLHTLGFKDCADGMEELELELLPKLSPKMKRLDLDIPPYPDLLSDICNLKNLTILTLQMAVVEDYELKEIVRHCKKLVALDISHGTFLTDACLCDLRFLPQLKSLDISSNDEFSNGGLQYLSDNLRELRVSMNKFSENALLKVLRRMQKLEVLDVSSCMHLKKRFVESAIDVVKNRSNAVPLTIGLLNIGTGSDEIKNSCPKVKLVWDDFLWPNYNQYL
ncbi:hypothetical protein QAD02_018983 [Eretmocerus hayati]|uniref:Uncharacterized protein n=1 Tax=Eretmocerus hayati TaxID=131215 RepID=A0ACC2PJI0_9HYME|nr:hypothetical protein QAD02_018983 [Eretmocerus hayati]